MPAPSSTLVHHKVCSMEQFKNTGYPALGGIIVSFIGISGQDVIKTIVLGIIGTVVSFLISALLARWLGRKG